MAPENQDLEWLTVGETNAILNAISEPRDKAIITLVISTGLFMNEIIELKPTDIDWENRILKLTGDRARELPLNDQAYTALAAWTKDRPDTPAKQFFLTTKGKVKALSARTVNHIITKYSHAAGLNKQVNAYTLRSTFAVNLFTQVLPWIKPQPSWASQTPKLCTVTQTLPTTQLPKWSAPKTPKN